MIDQLRSVGIEKGHRSPLTGRPRGSQRGARSASVARGEVRCRYAALLRPQPLDRTRALRTSSQRRRVLCRPESYPLAAGGLIYSYAFIGIKRLGAGQFYLITIQDRDGDAFDGGKTYRLTVPPNVPVEQYWSMTAYDRETHALIKNMPRASRSSQIPELQTNPDGSVDIYFGPKAPAGKEANWIPTDPVLARDAGSVQV